MKKLLRRRIVSAVLPVLCALLAFPLLGAGTVYLVLGSDTAIWDGMDVANYHPTYALDLFLDPTMNAYRVMDPAFRLPMTDSYGTPMKLTWWMMGGDIYRFATNTNVPVPNTMTLYVMKKYHLDRIRQYGDELSLHYHTFAWTDYDKDGKYYWNEAHSFAECRDDFDVTLAQYLLEENCFPVSFRSGWHYMDNGWQQYLNTLLPYSMHDDYPNKRSSITEPIDNVYDWSLSSKDRVPFRPLETNYQLGGGSGGWNARSEHMGSITASDVNDMFLQASKGTDQVGCFWGHLPETDYLDNLKKMDSLAHKAAALYPTVRFRYCTAVEAMQRWRNTTDTTKPVLTLSSEPSADRIAVTIRTDKPIFQAAPVVAQKDIYERASLVACTKTGVNTWKAVSTVPASALAKIAVAVTDTLGNLSTNHLSFLPDDQYIDNLDTAYHELRGTWTTTTNASWGVDARQAVLVDNDSVMSTWSATIPQTAYYNFFIQVPTISNAAFNSVYRIRAGSTLLSEQRFPSMISSKTWNLIGTQMLTSGTRVTVERVANGTGQAGRIAASDVVKISAMVRDRSISSPQMLLNAGDVSETDTARIDLTIANSGINPLTISRLWAASSAISFPNGRSLTIPAMSSVTVPVRAFPGAKGTFADTIRIASNDPLVPELDIPFMANVMSYFLVADNDDASSYSEIGSWYNSNASDCYGATSRYASLGPKARAVYIKTLVKSGIYDMYELLPKSVNSSTRARYVIKVNGVPKDSVFLDQNAGSGAWVPLFRQTLPAGVPIEMDVSDASTNTAANLVLRADAIRFTLKLETAVERQADAGIPQNFRLAQNYPNPFNPSTSIRFDVPVRSHIRLEVFNTVGQSVGLLEDGVREAGVYLSSWHAQVPSGLYFLRFSAQPVGNTGAPYAETRKMMLLR